MPRPRKFNEKDVLDNVMLIFWQKGYAGTSTEDLEQATQLKRGSLYNAYKDKRSLFFRILDHYGKQEIDEVVDIMTSTGGLLAGYGKVLERAISYAGKEEHLGCLLCDAASELGGKDKAVADRVNQLFLPMASVFFDYFSSANTSYTDNEITAKVDTVMATYMGFRLMCKLGYSKKRLHGLAQESCMLLRC
jgi:TetR/AcrR family transcriptional repressor of nem operon